MSKRLTDTKDHKPASANRVLVCSTAAVFRPPLVSVDVSFEKMIAPNCYTSEQEVSPDDTQRLCDSLGSGVQWMTGDAIEALERTVPKRAAKFEPLTAALVNYFDKPLGKLPSALRKRVDDDLLLRLLWDKATPEGRRNVVEDMDYRNDPATEPERDEYWNLWAVKDEVEREIREIESRAWNDFTDLKEQKALLDEVRVRFKTAKGNLDQAVESRKAGATAPDRGAVPLSAIMQAFQIPNVPDNEKWWKDRTGEVRRYGLVGCRALTGGGNKQSYWFPELVAGWLVDKEHLAVGRVVGILRRSFDNLPKCVETAELLEQQQGG